jgi:hypothetical protein
VDAVVVVALVGQASQGGFSSRSLNPGKGDELTRWSLCPCWLVLLPPSPKGVATVSSRKQRKKFFFEVCKNMPINGQPYTSAF